MNKERRKQLNEINELIESIKSTLEGLTGEEEEYRDNIPENLQASERFERADEACSYLYYALDSLDEAIENISEAINI